MQLQSEAETAALAHEIAQTIRRGDIICLKGDLGSGKTTFARVVIQDYATVPIDVPSPTFTLVQLYEFDRLQIAHVDLYRVDIVEELDELGLDDLWSSGAMLIEWPEIAQFMLPSASCLTLQFDHSQTANPDQRTVRISGGARWRNRLPVFDR